MKGSPYFKEMGPQAVKSPLPPSLDASVLFELFKREEEVSETVRLSIWKEDGKTCFSFSNVPPKNSQLWRAKRARPQINGKESVVQTEKEEVTVVESSDTNAPSPPLTRRKKRMRSASSPTLNSPETVRAEDLQHSINISPLVDDRQHTLDGSAVSPKTRIEASIPTRNRFDLLSTPIGHNDDDDDQEDDTDVINDCEYVEGCYLNHISDPDGCEGCMCGKLKPCKTKYCDIHACLHCPTTRAIKIFMG